MKILNEEEKRKILESIIDQQNFKTEVKPEEFTFLDLVRDYNLTRHQAEILIKKLLSENKIVARDAIRKGKCCTAYSFTE